jgi:hypothetical protein
MAPVPHGSDFVDDDLQGAQAQGMTGRSASVGAGSGAVAPSARPPTREELDQFVSETHQKLAELKRAQEELEKKRAALEEERRRHAELHQGRQEMLQHLVRGVGLLEEAEFNARQEAEQVAKTLAGLRDATVKIQSIQEESWTPATYPVELTKALTTIENARMEWNAARLKWPRLSGASQDPAAVAGPGAGRPSLSAEVLECLGFIPLCRLGLGLHWPLLLVSLAGLGCLLLLLWRR